MATSEGIPDIPPAAEPVPPAVEGVDLGPIGPRQRYEFTRDQEQVIGDLAVKMGFVGAFLLAMTTLGAVWVAYVLYRTDFRYFDGFTALNALIYGCLAIWTLRASGAFASVAATVGRDVSHLMDALSSLRKMYSLLYWLLVMAIVASFLLLLMPIFMPKVR